MIAIINVRPAREIPGTEVIPRLPDPPALRWSAFLIGTGGELTLNATVAWALEMRDARPMVPIALAASIFRPDQSKLLDALARTGLRFTLIPNLRPVPGHELGEGVDALRKASVESDILQTWLRRWGPPAATVEYALVQLISHGVRGGKRKSLEVIDPAAHPVSPSTLERRLKRAGLPAPGQLLREARLLGAELREKRFLSPAAASRAAGYTSQRDRRQASKRRG
jgi:hypothetical protein